MKPSDTEAQAPFVFPWRKGHRLAPFLPGYLLLSIAAHVATFFLFRVVYPERVSIPAAPPQVSLLTPTTAENQAFLRWIDSEDPALVASGVGNSPAVVPDVPYRPSFEVVRTMPRTVPAPAQTLRFPPAKPPLEIIRSGEEHAKPAPPEIKPRATTFTFEATLAKRAPDGVASFPPVHRAKDPLQPATFLVGVTADGEVRFTFLQISSGDAALDAEAVAHLAKTKFAPGADEMTWSIVLVSWGDDAYRIAPPSP
jgi:hypothetical protein